MEGTTDSLFKISELFHGPKKAKLKRPLEEEKKVEEKKVEEKKVEEKKVEEQKVEEQKVEEKKEEKKEEGKKEEEKKEEEKTEEEEDFKVEGINGVGSAEDEAMELEALGIEKGRIVEVNKFQSDQIDLNVGGQLFTTTIETLTSKPGSLFEIMFSGRHTIDVKDNRPVFIDRDGYHFRYILNYLRGIITHKNQLPKNAQTLKEIKVECDYYQLPELVLIIDGKMIDGKVVILQTDIDNCLKLENEQYFSVKDIVMTNSILDGFNFFYFDSRNKDKNLTLIYHTNFIHSADFTDSSLKGTKFHGVRFNNSCKYVFDGCDLEGCSFLECAGFHQIVKGKNSITSTFGSTFKSMITSGKITFNNVKNIDKALFDDPSINITIENMYDL